jgi:hypothetical protein
MTERSNPDPYGHALEKRAALEEWETRKRAEAAHKQREQKQAELAAYLKRRGEDYMDHAGEKPTLDDLAAWRREYMAEKENEYRRERQKKIDSAIQDNYKF